MILEVLHRMAPSTEPEAAARCRRRGSSRRRMHITYEEYNLKVDKSMKDLQHESVSEREALSHSIPDFVKQAPFHWSALAN